MTERRTVGLIAGNGRFPFLFAQGARHAGARVVAVGYRGETDPALESEVDELLWMNLSQLGKVADAFLSRGVAEAAMLGGIRKLGVFLRARPDLRTLRMAASLKHLNDDALLKGIAGLFEREGVRIIPSTEYLGEVLAKLIAKV